MTRAELKERVEYWRSILAPEWRVKLMDEAPEDSDDEFWAMTQIPNPEYHETIMHFPDESLKRPSSLLEVTIVHELLHTLVHRVGRYTLDELNRHVTPLVFDDAVDRMKSREETFVDRLARSIVALQSGQPQLATGTREGNGNNWSHDEATLT